MKRIFLLGIVLALCFAGCSLKTYTTDEILPAAVDESTLLPLIDAVTVTRAEDGASVTVTGTDVETLMLAFDSLTCTRKAPKVRTDVYTLSFSMAEADEAPSDLFIRRIDETGELTLTVGEYEYYLVNTRLDTAYLDSLFSDK